MSLVHAWIPRHIGVRNTFRLLGNSVHIYIIVASLWASPLVVGWGADILVADRSQLTSALRTAQPSDRILLAPGTYAGGLFEEGLAGVTIRSQFPDNRAVIEGGVNAIQLSDATDVTIEHLILQGQTGNGLNIDDGGTFDTPSSNITLRHLLVRNIGPDGNTDGIKLSGVTRFLIDQVDVVDWGSGGSAIDMVGSHHGLIQNSIFTHSRLTELGSGIRPKGGSKDVTIRANRLEIPTGTGRAIQAGGSTDPQFFRFIDGDSGYEAAEIVAEGNVVVGSAAPFSYVNIDGGVFHHNFADRPQRWAVRILNENGGNPIVDTQNGQFIDNIVRFNDTGGEFVTAVNSGPETLPETFTFRGNQWYNMADPTVAGSTPTLPVAESDGIYGIPPQYGPAGVVPWSFPWGLWLVNANRDPGQFPVQGGPYLLATPESGAEFRPLAANPLVGNWSTVALPNGDLQLSARSQAILIRAPLGNTDLNGDGVIDAADAGIMFASWGGTGGADLNRDAIVDAADAGILFGEWTGEPVPEPNIRWLICILVAMNCRCKH